MAKISRPAPAKYADKSKGQPELVALYDKLRKILSSYRKGNYIVKADKPGHYELYYGKEVEVKGRKYPELSFASLLIQKGYVGFYFFPVYVNPSLKEKINPDLLSTIKGKTCFHIKKNDPGLMKQINEALQMGYTYFNDNF